jgi:hypothetical protein
MTNGPAPCVSASTIVGRGHAPGAGLFDEMGSLAQVLGFARLGQWGRILKALILAFFGGLVLAVPVSAQGNDDEYTPLGSRIRRDRQFPLDIADRFRQDERSKVTRARSKAMLGQMAQCLYRRAGQDATELLEKTDYGFVAFEQIGLKSDRALKIYGFSDCLSRVAEANSAGGVQIRFWPGSLRQWMLEEAYFARFRDAPTWVKPGHVVAERSYPLSANDPNVRLFMDFADCVVQSDPYAADFFFRVSLDSAEAKTALNALMPSLGPCLPEGQKFELAPAMLRIWLGEGLWHAANHNAPPSGDASEVVR